MPDQNSQQEFSLSGAELLNKVKEVIKEGKALKLIIKDKDGEILIEIPLVIGAVGAVALPVLAAIGVFAALVTECTLIVVTGKKEEKS